MSRAQWGRCSAGAGVAYTLPIAAAVAAQALRAVNVIPARESVAGGAYWQGYRACQQCGGHENRTCRRHPPPVLHRRTDDTAALARNAAISASSVRTEALGSARRASLDFGTLHPRGRCREKEDGSASDRGQPNSHSWHTAAHERHGLIHPIRTQTEVKSGSNSRNPS
jgi:hypothetical protein